MLSKVNELLFITLTMQVVMGEHFVNGQDKNQIWVSEPSTTFYYRRKGGGVEKFYFELLSFFKEWVVFVLLPPSGIYRTYCPTHEIKATSFCVT